MPSDAEDLVAFLHEKNKPEVIFCDMPVLPLWLLAATVASHNCCCRTHAVQCVSLQARRPITTLMYCKQTVCACAGQESGSRHHHRSHCCC